MFGGVASSEDSPFESQKNRNVSSILITRSNPDGQEVLLSIAP
jgi:hypothetical protein